MGHPIFESCNTLAQDRLLETEALVTLSLGGRHNDSDRTALLKTVIDIIAKDLPTDIVQKIVSLYRVICGCTRTHDEFPACIANKLCSLVTRTLFK